MVQKKPKKLFTREKRIILQEKLKGLIQLGYSQVELSRELDEIQPIISWIISHGEVYSISLDKTENLIIKSDELINSLI